MAKRVAIVGGGVVGLFAAWHALQRGFRVVVIERGPERREGCSFGNSGLIVPSHFVPLAAPGAVRQALKWMRNPESPFYVRPRLSWDLLTWGLRFWRAASATRVRAAAPVLLQLHNASRAEYERLARDWGDELAFVPNGLLMLCKTQHALDDEARTAVFAQSLGVEARICGAKETAALDPGVTMDVCGAVFYPQDCRLSPERLMSGLQARLAACSCEFYWNTAVNAFAADGRRLRAAGDIEADEFVLAGGVWSSDVARTLGLNLPMQAGKGYSLTLAQPRQLPTAASICVEARVAVTPMASALRFGGTMEMSGVNEEVNAARVRGIVNSVPRYFPAFTADDFANVQPWHGLRPVSPDGLPYIGRAGRYDNLTVATGHAMMGVSLAPVTGLLVGQLLAGETPAMDLRLLAPDRFG